MIISDESDLSATRRGCVGVSSAQFLQTEAQTDFITEVEEVANQILYFCIHSNTTAQ